MMMLKCIKQHLSNICRSIHEKVKQHWGWVEKSVAYKKSVYFVGSSNDPPRSWCESVFNLSFAPSWISSCFCVNGEKKSFSRPDFVDSETAIWGLTSLTGFYKSVQLLFKKQHVSDCQNKISFVQITHLKFAFLTLDDIKSFY